MPHHPLPIHEFPEWRMLVDDWESQYHSTVMGQALTISHQTPLEETIHRVRNLHVSRLRQYRTLIVPPPSTSTTPCPSDGVHTPPNCDDHQYVIAEISLHRDGPEDSDSDMVIGFLRLENMCTGQDLQPRKLSQSSDPALSASVESAAALSSSAASYLDPNASPVFSSSSSDMNPCPSGVQSFYIHQPPPQLLPVTPEGSLEDVLKPRLPDAVGSDTSVDKLRLGIVNVASSRTCSPSSHSHGLSTHSNPHSISQRESRLLWKSSPSSSFMEDKFLATVIHDTLGFSTSDLCISELQYQNRGSAAVASSASAPNVTRILLKDFMILAKVVMASNLGEPTPRCVGFAECLGNMMRVVSFGYSVTIGSIDYRETPAITLLQNKYEARRRKSDTELLAVFDLLQQSDIQESQESRRQQQEPSSLTTTDPLRLAQQEAAHAVEQLRIAKRAEHLAAEAAKEAMHALTNAVAEFTRLAVSHSGATWPGMVDEDVDEDNVAGLVEGV